MRKLWVEETPLDLSGDCLVVLERGNKFSAGNQLAPNTKEPRALLHSQGSLLFDIEGSWLSPELDLNISVHHTSGDGIGCRSLYALFFFVRPVHILNAPLGLNGSSVAKCSHAEPQNFSVFREFPLSIRFSRREPRLGALAQPVLQKVELYRDGRSGWQGQPRCFVSGRNVDPTSVQIIAGVPLGDSRQIQIQRQRLSHYHIGNDRFDGSGCL
mmetsp:Transcript_9358/g.27945  ORF Transcript_9358/g.27945 Transcript_9358/m.27945 type:complete len:213 (-) Transcript_9358:617-1255(-)